MKMVLEVEFLWGHEVSVGFIIKDFTYSCYTIYIKIIQNNIYRQHIKSSWDRLL